MRRSFSLIELVFVIILLGILAAVAVPKMSISVELKSATEQVINHIRYTQHLAMMDERFNPDDTGYNQNGCATSHPGKWFRERWRVRFYSNTGTHYYAVFSDRNRCKNIDYSGNIEPAIDPSDPSKLLYVSEPDQTDYNPKMNLTKTFQASVSSTCNRTTTITEIYFDELGRPYNDVSSDASKPYDHLLTSQCIITLTHPTEGKSCIAVEPITGYTHQIICP